MAVFDIIENINDALDSWYENLDKVIDVVTTNPRNMGGGAVDLIVKNLYNTTEAIGISLLVLCFFIGIFGAASSMAETKRPEAVFKLLIRTGVTATLVTRGFDFMDRILDICQSLVRDLNNSVSFSNTEVPQEIVTAVSDVGFLEKIPILIVSLLGSIAILVASFIVLLTVYGRFFKVYLYMIISPIPLATFAAKSTSQISISFIKNYIGVGLEAAVIIASIQLYKVYSTTVLDSPLIDTTATASSMVWGYLTTTIFNILILVIIIKTSTSLVKEMFGL